MTRLLVAFAFVLALAPRASALTITDVERMVRAVHDAEHVNLGAASTRDQRNAFWARAIGIVHWGHPVYNPTPDNSWCIKDAGNGRPQSDDVVVKCATREYWDCIPGSGADGYRFSCGQQPGTLGSEQNVYAPPKPAGGGVSSGGGGTPPSTPPSTDLGPVLQAIAALSAKLDTLKANIDGLDGGLAEAVRAARSAEIDAREVNQWRMQPQPPVPVLAVPCLVGRVPKPFGGSSEVTFCPKVQ